MVLEFSSQLKDPASIL